MLTPITALEAVIKFCAHSAAHFWCWLTVMMAGFSLTTYMQVAGQTACVPMSTAVRPLSSSDMLGLLGLLERVAPALGIAGNLSRSCIGEVTGSGSVASPGYPCHPSWLVDDDDTMTVCVWKLNKGSGGGRHDLWRIQLEELRSTSSETGSVRLLAFDSFPPAIRHVDLPQATSDKYLNFQDAATLVLLATGKTINRSMFLLSASLLLTEVTAHSSTLSIEPAQDRGQPASKNTCVPLGNTTFEDNLPSEETRIFVQMVQAEYERSSGGTALNLTCLKELRGSGTVYSRNYPCNYPNHELCGWILFAEGAPISNITAIRSTTSARRDRRRIRLRFVSFKTEQTYDQLLVLLPSGPPEYGKLLDSISGNRSTNYTMEIDSEIIGLLFTSSKATTASGFMIDFTTVISDDGLSTATSPADHTTWWSTSDISTAISVAAVVLCGTAIAAFIAYKRRRGQRERANMSDGLVAAYTAKPGPTAGITPAMPSDSFSNKDGLVFGGRRRPDVLLVYCEDDRTHCAVIDSLAQILRSLGGCDVRTISAAHPSHTEQCHNDRSAAICCNQLRSAALQADRMVVFASRGADLVEEAFLCGKVYPRLYRSSAAYLAIPIAIELCTSCSLMRTKTLVVVYDFREDGCQSDVGDSAFNSDGSSSRSPRSTVVRQLGDDVPVFRLLEDMPRLVAALLSATQAESAAAASSGVAHTSVAAMELLLRSQASVIWSCLEEYAASNERRQLTSCVAAVERSAMQGVLGSDLFEAAHGQAADCWDESAGLTGSVGAIRLSVTTESHQLSVGGLTDVVTLPSLADPCKSNDSGASESGMHVGYSGSSSNSTGNIGGHTDTDGRDSGHLCEESSSVIFS